MKKIDRNEFTRQTLEPDKEVQRVKVMLPNGGNKRSLRLFDTPGYDSIIDEHEEILTEFLPNSDVVVYTVSYRIGIQKTDYSFLSRARELIREDAQILLAINMCPEDCTESDRRISEIQKYVESVLHYKPQLFLIKTQPSADDYSYPIPDGKALYEGIIGCAESPGKLALVEDALNGYVDELYHKSSEIIAQRYMQAHLSEKQAADIRHEQKAASRRILDAIPDLVDPAFEKLIRTIPDKIRQAADNAYEKVCEDIDASKKGTMDEMRNFVCVHSIPFALDNETSEILRQEEIILDDLNEQLDDYINETLEMFTNKVIVITKTNLEAGISYLAVKGFSEAEKRGLTAYFAAFGGAGGGGAGVANAASHLLKKVGDVFGHTFKRQTHNALKHFLSKIGATSMKFVGAALSALIDLATVGYEYATWKGKLKKSVRKAIDQWADETIPEYVKSLEELKKTNIETLETIVAERVNAFRPEPAEYNVAELKAQLDEAKIIGERIGV